jgi:serine/threonine protein kinase
MTRLAAYLDNARQCRSVDRHGFRCADMNASATGGSTLICSGVMRCQGSSALGVKHSTTECRIPQLWSNCCVEPETPAATNPGRNRGGPRQRARKGRRLGRWTLLDRLGSGGNGDVYAARRDDGTTAAFKILRNPDHRERMGRFRQEVEFLRRDPDRRGVLGILDSDLEPNTGPPWYAMPMAVLLSNALGPDPTVEAVVDAFIEYSSTLAALHAEGTGHRDLKPDNLFQLDEDWVIGDFGLVQHPDTEPLTKAGKRLGPIDFMAPEMRSNADSADAGPADVYSLAKTLWVVLTGTTMPLPGPHRPDDEAYALVNRIDHPWAALLDSLLRRATLHAPLSRLTMDAVHAELSALKSIGAAATQATDLDELAATLRRYAEPQQQRMSSAAALEQRLNQSSSTFHDVLHSAYVRLEVLLSGWRQNRRSDESAIAYRLLEPSHWPHKGQRGREDEFSVDHPTDAAKTIIVKLSVAVRLKVDGETLAVAGGVTVQDYVATEPEWLRSVAQEVPMTSSLEARIVDDLRLAYAEGVDAALRHATAALQ